jgi:hypothetical protein
MEQEINPEPIKTRRVSLSTATAKDILTGYTDIYKWRTAISETAGIFDESRLTINTRSPFEETSSAASRKQVPARAADQTRGSS